MELNDPATPGSPRAGDVLIANPTMPDGHFAQTLIYLQEHSPEGSLGVILNRPLGRTLAQFLPSAEFPGPLGELPMFFGGPVQSDQFLLTLFRCHPVTHGFECVVNPDRDEIEAAFDDPACRLRAFVGYAGWSAGQLADEVSRRDWLWTAPDEVMLRRSPTPALWSLLVKGDFRWRKLRNYLPEDPERN